ncbi:hypothetical protein [Flavobacterium sp. 5]|uniref:hypothetical protein n=1 Tax=Flavobacterium sp. 5 TaxID=2035199 RepID=UPI000C2C33B8|nr:hypothetical protein [Flavobacterium sp. 5]PKB15208.1 hypothetical protein CLU82_0272 [Flavobacterium sp. 5]PKB15226.1 hypothetical protein CLU82_0290 [Flavobacterium sp. 5]
MSTKKEIERHHLTSFISNEKLKLLVYGIEDSETPDFIVNIDKKLISIEHTRLINPHLQKVEQYRERIIKNARIRFEEKYSAKLYLLVTFNNIILKSGKVAEEKYTTEVFTLIENIYLCNKDYEFTIHSKNRKAKVSELIESFSVDNTRNFSNWQHFGAYLVDWVDMEWLKDVIEKKENNIERYQKQFYENWLLLVSDFGTKASSHRFDRIDYSGIKTKFDKIYLYSFRADKIEIVK